MNQKQSISSTLQKFLTKWLDFKGRSNQLEHWIPAAFYIALFSGFYFILLEVFKDKTLSLMSLIGTLSSNSAETALANLLNSYQESKFAIYSLAIYSVLIPGLLTILVIAFTSSLSRRLRDIGFATGAIAILVGLLHFLLIIGVPYLSAIYAILVALALPILASDTVLTNNNDGFSKFLFRQNPQAAAYYASQGQPGFGFNPSQGGQNTQVFNQNSVNNGQVSQQVQPSFNQTPVNSGQAPQQQGFNQVPVNNSQVAQQSFNQAPANNRPVVQETAPVKEEVVNTPTSIKDTAKTDAPKGEKTKEEENINPFGDQVFKK